MLTLFSGISPLISSSEKSFSSLFSMTPSLCRLREAPSHLSCDTVFPIPCCQTLAVLPPTKKIPRLRSGWRYEKNAFPTHSFFAWCTRYPFPTLSFRAQSRNPPCTLFFLAPFAEGFQFYFVTHTTLYRCARKIEGFARDDVAEMAFSKHIRCTLREINPFPPYRHFEHSEKSSLHSALSCSFRKSFPLFRCHTYDAISVCKKDRGLRSGWRYRNSAFSAHPLYDA